MKQNHAALTHGIFLSSARNLSKMQTSVIYNDNVGGNNFHEHFLGFIDKLFLFPLSIN